MYTSFLMVLGSCLSAQPAPNDSAVSKRPLKWAADPNGGVPYIFHEGNDENNPVGFEVDLKDALARELDRPIEFTFAKFENLFDGLKRGDFDFAMNGLETTPINMTRALFTRPYYVYQLQLVVREGEERFRTLEEAKANNMKLGVLGGSEAQQVLRRMRIQENSYDDQDGPFKDLALGRTIQGVFIDVPVALYYGVSQIPTEKQAKVSSPFLRFARRHQGLKFAGQPVAGGFYAIAVRQDNQELARQIDQALERLLRSGEIKRILQKWDLWNVDQYRLYAEAPTEKPALATPHFAVYFMDLLQGAGMTVFITVCSMTLAILLALPIALCRMYGPLPLRWLAIGYVEFFRGIPVLFLLYFLYFGLADISPALAMQSLNAAIIGFGLNYAAYEAEVYRASISGIPVGQWEAAASLGMTPVQTFWRVILPQSFRGILPPMTNDLVSLFKDTSLVSVIAVKELNQNYQTLSKDFGGYLPIALTTAALYLLMSVPLGYVSRYLEKRWGAR